MRVFLFIFITICISVILASCKKDKLLTDPSARVSFSQDSVLFDTVFTTIGSATRSIHVINNNNQKINISSIRLEQGQSSQFFLNVDGVPGKQVDDVEILAKDSIYIFIQVNVNPTSALSPLVIQDKIVFEINGNHQELPLEAWGQDAHYHFPNTAIQYQNGFLPYSTVSYSISPSGEPVSLLNTTVNWGGGALGQPDDNKPHVIYGWLVVDSAQTLVINPGVKVYFHKNAGLWTYRYGTLQVKGTLGNEVVFQGDRREADYADKPGQWDRIWINEGSKNNSIDYAIIKNSFIGIQASILLDPNVPNRNLKLTNTIIKNCSKWGLYTQFFNIWSGNNVICNCKEYCAALTMGGKYTFLHTTFANYYNQDGGRGSQPSVHIDNFDGTDTWPCDSVYFANSIVYGTLGNEFEYDLRPTTFSPNPMYKVEHCLLKTSVFTGTTITNANNDFSGSPDFSSPGNYDFKIGSNSAAIGIGTPGVGTYPILFSDIKGQNRNFMSGQVDAGAYNH